MFTTRKLPSRLHHTAYTTKDMEKTRAFYEEVIGLPLVATWSESDELFGKVCTYCHCFFGLADGGALAGQTEGNMLPWTVRELTSGTIIGSTRYHDIVAAIDRVEIGATWYAQRSQCSHVNTSCKLLRLGHAFDALGCQVVGLRTNNFNLASQRVIEALGAKKDGVIRHHRARRDGTVCDTVIYSIFATEWPDVKRHLERRLARHRSGSR